ncbi:unnamed protein product [Cylindrotheca closterium]|uniref:Arf-GAP domain-containing protein n=1 Tax=Cylindrotheca closterium TaxID=2856 RepID=A0AAD2JJ11_9STRA|nr:unnamed protein product [Cylindrotheca closterium]
MKRAFGRKTNATGKSQRELFQCLNKLQQKEANQSCCDCGVQDPEWAVIFKKNSASSSSRGNIRNEDHPEPSIGAFVCYACSVAHKMLAIPTTEIKSISVGSWTHSDVLAMERGGNQWVNALYEADLVKKKGQKPTEASEMLRRQAFCHLKYVRLWYYADENSETPADETSDDELLDFVTSRSERQTRTVSPPSIPENWEKPQIVSTHDDDPWWEPPNDASIATLTTVADSLYGSSQSRLSFGTALSNGPGWSSHSRLSYGSSTNSAGWSSHSRLGHGGGGPILSSHSRASLGSITPTAKASRRLSTGGMEIVLPDALAVAPSPSPVGFSPMRSPPGTPRQRRQRRRSSMEGRKQFSNGSLSKPSINPRVSVKLSETAALDLNSSPQIRKMRPRMASRQLSLPERVAMPQEAMEEFPHLPKESWTSPKTKTLTSPRQTRSAHRRTRSILEKAPPSRRNSLPDFFLEMNESMGETSGKSGRLNYNHDDDDCSDFAVQQKQRYIHQEIQSTPRVSHSKPRSNRRQRRNSISETISTGQGLIVYKPSTEFSSGSTNGSNKRRQSLQFLRESLGPLDSDAPKW